MKSKPTRPKASPAPAVRSDTSDKSDQAKRSDRSLKPSAKPTRLTFSNGLFRWGVTLPAGWALAEPDGKTGEGEYYASPDRTRGVFLSVWVLPVHDDSELEGAIDQFCQMEQDSFAGMRGHNWKVSIRRTPAERGTRTLFLDAREADQHSRIVIRLLARNGCLVTASFHDYAFFGPRSSDAWIRPLLRDFKVLSVNRTARPAPAPAAATAAAPATPARTRRPAATKSPARARR